MMLPSVCQLISLPENGDIKETENIDIMKFTCQPGQFITVTITNFPSNSDNKLIHHDR